MRLQGRGFLSKIPAPPTSPLPLLGLKQEDFLHYQTLHLLTGSFMACFLWSVCGLGSCIFLKGDLAHSRHSMNMYGINDLLATTSNGCKSRVHKPHSSRNNDILNIPEICHTYAGTEFLTTFL